MKKFGFQGGVGHLDFNGVGVFRVSWIGGSGGLVFFRGGFPHTNTP